MSKRKSLWIRHCPRSAGWCASSQPVTGDQSPRSSVAARASRSVQPPTWRATYPSPRFSAASAGIADTSTACRSTSTSQARPQSVATSLGRRLETQAPPGDRALQPLHHVELRADHRLVAAEPDHGGDVREDRRERRLDVVLAAHVVGALGLRTGRRAAQDEVAGGVRQQVGQVRGAAGELADLGGADQVVRRRVLAQPGRDRRRRRTRPPRGPAGSRRGCSCVAREPVQLVGLGAHHQVVGQAVVLLQLPGALRRDVGDDQLVAGSTPTITAAAMSSAVSGEDSTRCATTPARAVSAPCMESIRLVRK